MSAGHGHDHTHGMAKKTLRIAFFLTLIILAAEVIGGLIANSLALLSDAGHVLTDIFALGLAWFATVRAELPADARNTFGHHRVGILAALANAVTLILITVWILWEAAQRFQHPEPVQPFAMFFSAGIGIVVNLFIGFGLQKEHDNLNVRAAALHVFGDIGASFAVIISGVIILLTGWILADPILSVGIAVLIALGAWRILRETTDILLETTPKDINLAALVRDMMRVTGVEDVHDLHVWSITSGMYALSCHARIDDIPPSQSSAILTSLEDVLEKKYRIGHTTIQFESDVHQGSCCAEDGLYCRLESYRDHEHGHDHDLDHEHEHDHDYDYAPSHQQDQAHDHNHEHVPDQDYKSDHAHNHDHEHKHAPSYQQDQVHDHNHEHVHDQDYESDHAHNHDHEHDHDHDYAPSHQQDQVHEHVHDQDHDHEHRDEDEHMPNDPDPNVPFDGQFSEGELSSLIGEACVKLGSQSADWYDWAAGRF